MRTKSNIVLALTLGDPGGIGPEIALKAAFSSRLPQNVRIALVGDRDLLRQYSNNLKLPLPPIAHFPTIKSDLPRVSCWTPSVKSKREERKIRWKPGATGKSNGGAAARWIESAVAGCLSGWFDGMVTGPISKKSLQSAGVSFPGHTEYLAALTGTSRFAMMLIGGPLRVVLVTRHIPLADVAGAITREAIIESAELVAQALRWLGLKNQKIGVCALNPHGGEKGILGNEEDRIITPAVQFLKKQKFDVEGPVPADVSFHYALKNRYGALVAMYHDQGLAPLKMIAFDKGVNLTLGLPIVRTSPDHGTAFDIAGKGIANPGSMIQAIQLAAKLAARKNPWK